MTPLTHLNLDINEKQLLDIAVRHRERALPYLNDKKIIENPQGFITDATDPYVDYILEQIKLSGRYYARFGWIKPNTELSEHIDSNTQCSINFLLSDNLAPIIINGVEYYYTQAIINVQQPHKVINGPEERVMLRITVLDESYESLVNRLVYKL